ncbi:MULTISPECIES: ABC transporter ATP-binding protein [unclassified Paenibacillus]|uniref:ABC transporter ATP-binding protein n=1 Tax=unclassified Paenibacillus TaxID=185978 RepID=UPI001C0F40A0|nr:MULTISPECIES: ABC transporter ATP-binding protein [unclassified Paenibacillus]MBU5445091.1 ABC transporter ATP-binding protein [Paenibacillus sp. MSJ-34]CAH0122392.1 Bacitracin transport ATP-binding protein BcrA [Paenibacillus sp. CECT 9249]
MAQYVLETNSLCKQFGGQISVDRVNLQIPEGSVYGFLGPNGAGKSTTIKMLLGLIKPDGGSIAIFGKPFPKARIEILQQVGSLVESPSYYGHLSGYKNMKIAATLLGVPESHIEEALELVRLTGQAHKAVRKYSLGMKQRLAIAMAIIHRPKLLILDEPTNGLDPSGIQEIRSLIVDMPRRYGMTVLVSSHLLYEIEQVADHVGIIHQGKLIYQGTLSALREQSGDQSLEQIFLGMTGMGRSL